MRVGAQPVGLRGDPLHSLQTQIRAVVRRRLGDRHYHLLAEPQPYAHSGQVDWYSELPGDVRPLRQLAEPERGEARAEIDTLLAEIDRLGVSLEAGSTEDIRLAGGFLRLAACPPADECCYRVGDQPLVIGWGYEVRSVTDVASKAMPATPAERAPESSLPPPAIEPVPQRLPPVAAITRRAPFPWFASLVAGLAGIVIVLWAAWALRQVVPEVPVPQVTELPPPPPPPPPPPIPDPMPGLRRAIDAERDDGSRLTATLASLREALSAKIAQCKPDLPEDGWKRRDLSVLEGCWILGHETPAVRRPPGAPEVHGVTTAARLCFARTGRGTFEVSSRFADGADQCKGQVTAAYEADGIVRITYPNLPCTRAGVPSNVYWVAGTLTCRRADDTKAICSSGGNTSLEFRRADSRR